MRVKKSRKQKQFIEIKSSQLTIDSFKTPDKIKKAKEE
jgi:hypothetical protein